MNSKSSAVLFVPTGVLVAITFFALAGPLDPPAGPVTPTYKTLTEVEPRIAVSSTNTPGDADSVFKISQPGSYYLTGNITGQAAKHGIEIAANDVMIDLSGFQLVGVPGSLSGISASASISSISVINGTVRSWGSDGVALQGGHSLIERIIAAANGAEGIDGGPNDVIRGCNTNNNSTDGIGHSTGTVIVDCTASDNTQDGIAANSRCVIRGCATEGNDGDGITGVFGTLIEDCASGSNTGSGISVTQGCHVMRCVVSTNGANGIVASNDATIVGNSADGNGTAVAGAGILVTNADCRIEGNQCTDNDHGIRATSGGNFFTRNTCSGNTTLNWDIASGNICLVVLGASSAAISGNAGGVSPGSNDPNANFTY